MRLVAIASHVVPLRRECASGRGDEEDVGGEGDAKYDREGAVGQGVRREEFALVPEAWAVEAPADDPTENGVEEQGEHGNHAEVLDEGHEGV